jgi:hypothetical protein
VDANVSNLSVASFLARASGPAANQLRVEQVVCTPDQQQAAARAAKKTRDRQRALDRSRRNTNPEQYSPSVRQHKRAERRAATALSPRQVTNPGPRHPGRGRDRCCTREHDHD